MSVSSYLHRIWIFTGIGYNMPVFSYIHWENQEKARKIYVCFFSKKKKTSKDQSSIVSVTLHTPFFYLEDLWIAGHNLTLLSKETFGQFQNTIWHDGREDTQWQDCLMGALLQVGQRSRVQALPAYWCAKASMLPHGDRARVSATCSAARKMTSQQNRWDFTQVLGKKLLRETIWQIQGVDLTARAFRQSGAGTSSSPKAFLPPSEETSISEAIILSSAGGSIFPLTEKRLMEDQAGLKLMSNFQVPVFSWNKSTQSRFTVLAGSSLLYSGCLFAPIVSFRSLRTR